MIINKAFIDKKTYVVCKVNHEDIAIGDVFVTSKGISFSVTGISSNLVEPLDDVVFYVTLEQIGYWGRHIKKIDGLKELLFEELTLVTDEKQLSTIRRESCYC